MFGINGALSSPDSERRHKKALPVTELEQRGLEESAKRYDFAGDKRVQRATLCEGADGPRKDARVPKNETRKFNETNVEVRALQFELSSLGRRAFESVERATVKGACKVKFKTVSDGSLTA